MKTPISKRRPTRRGAIAVLAAVFLIVMLGMVAFAVDVGWLSLVRTQLQSAADAAALAGAARICQDDMVTTAQSIGEKNTVSGRPVQINAADVQSGVWNANARTFTPSATMINAVRVTARTNANSGGRTPLFFGRVLGLSALDQEASAVATVNPRDILFVVDLSASMNYDTRPNRCDSDIGEELIENVFDDFGFGSYPGTQQYAGFPLTGQTTGTDWLSQLKPKLGDPAYKNTIYYTGKKIGSYYYDSNGVTKLDEATRNKRAYSWVMDIQIGQQLMPAATPHPNSTNTTSYNYWKTFIDNEDASTEKGGERFYKRLGYAAYVQFMMYYGRDDKPDNVSYTPLSTKSTICPYHTESTDGGVFQFPPQEQPTHAARRSIIAALQVVKIRNQYISDTSQKDWVSILTFDKKTGVSLLQGLTDNYTLAMEKATKMQACTSGANCTYTEGGLIEARDLIKPQSEGGTGREHVNKVIVLLTDGTPNLRYSGDWAIKNYVNAYPSDYFYTDVYSEEGYCKQASLMQASKIQRDNWYVFPVGIGLDVNTDFMDRMANIANTADENHKSRSSSDPSKYEAALKEIFETIITRPKLRLVQ